VTNKNFLKAYKSNEDKILSSLLEEIRNNPHFSATNLIGHSSLAANTKEFLTQIFKTLDSNSLPDVSKKMLEPIIALWDSLIKQQIQAGFSSKDMALLIYALKSTMHSAEEHEVMLEDTKKRQLDNVLDLLGMLTFEMYSIENEKIISAKNNHIHYLQQTNSKFSNQLIGNSPIMHQLYKTIGLVLENDLTVLLEGESGTGKDLIASTIHNNSKRSKKPFIAINCGAIPKDLIESELFGHEKGAFTGADEQRIGKFELADGGTLFLDEIGDLPLELQVKLLRILQNKSVERVGGKHSIPLNVRIIAATNQPLKQLVDEKKFRLDLYYRLNVFPIFVPPLRERKEDIALLAQFFIKKYAKEFELKESILTDEATIFLSNQYWEGNIRELENVIQRSLILAQGDPITSAILSLKPGQIEQRLLQAPQPKASSSPQEDTLMTLEEAEKKAIEIALSNKKNNYLQAAKALGISRTTLYSKIQTYKIGSDAKYPI
jgi:transcriptional regulator with GAF, ATPase, and Fis domain